MKKKSSKKLLSFSSSFGHTIKPKLINIIEETQLPCILLTKESEIVYISETVYDIFLGSTQLLLQNIKTYNNIGNGSNIFKEGINSEININEIITQYLNELKIQQQYQLQYYKNFENNNINNNKEVEEKKEKKKIKKVEEEEKEEREGEEDYDEKINKNFERIEKLEKIINQFLLFNTIFDENEFRDKIKISIKKLSIPEFNKISSLSSSSSSSLPKTSPSSNLTKTKKVDKDLLDSIIIDNDNENEENNNNDYGVYGRKIEDEEEEEEEDCESSEEENDLFESEYDIGDLIDEEDIEKLEMGEIQDTYEEDLSFLEEYKKSTQINLTTDVFSNNKKKKICFAELLYSCFCSKECIKKKKQCYLKLEKVFASISLLTEIKNKQNQYKKDNKTRYIEDSNKDFFLATFFEKSDEGNNEEYNELYHSKENKNIEETSKEKKNDKQNYEDIYVSKKHSSKNTENLLLNLNKESNNQNKKKDKDNKHIKTIKEIFVNGSNSLFPNQLSNNIKDCKCSNFSKLKERRMRRSEDFFDSSHKKSKSVGLNPLLSPKEKKILFLQNSIGLIVTTPSSNNLEIPKFKKKNSPSSLFNSYSL